MAGLADKAVGVYHYLTDKVPAGTSLVNPRPVPVNHWCRDGQPLVARVADDGDIKSSLGKVVKRLGGLKKAIKHGDRVLVKPNFNSPDPYPASTDPAFLEAVVELLLTAGARVTIGESAGGVWRPTRSVFEKLGLLELARRLGVDLIAFEDRANDWVRVKVDGDYLTLVTVPFSAYRADKIVYLPCLKTHNLARFSGALKLAVGFMHPGERRALHRRHLEQKAAEISLCWRPDLIIMDGRKAFVSGGPDKGHLVEPGILLASADLVAIDVEAMKILLSYGAKNKLARDPWRSTQIVTALKHNLGARQDGYIVVA